MLNQRKTANICIFLTGIVIFSFIGIGIISSKDESISQENNEPIILEENKTEEIKDGMGVATIDGVSVRREPSSSGTYLGSLYTGDKVEILEETSNGWYKIKYNDKEAYTSKLFIQISGVDYTPESVINSGKTTSQISVRSEANVSSSKLGSLKSGEVVQIVDESSKGWYRIQYDSKYGYVQSKNIKINKNITPSIPKDRKNLNNFLFIGDSFTYRLSDTIKSNNSNVFIKAQSGSRPSYWLDKVDAMPSNNSVEGVEILIGVNGVADTEKNINDTKKLINKLIERYPNKKIYIQRVFPVNNTFTEVVASEHNKKIAKFNKSIEEFCKTKSNVVVIDATDGFIDNNGYLKYSSDGLHIDENKNGDFYNNIFNAIKAAEKNNR